MTKTFGSLNLRGKLTFAALSLGAIVILGLPTLLITLALLGTGQISWRNFCEKWGLFRRPVQQNSEKHTSPMHIWIHLSSAGEWRTVFPLIVKLRAEYPEYLIAVTYFNAEMERIAATAVFTELVQRHAFMSLEQPLLTWRWLRAINARALLLVEAELWPLMLVTTRLYNIPIVLVSGVLFETEFKRLRCIAMSGLLRPVLHSLTTYLLSDALTVERFKQLGVPAERMAITGSLKLAAMPPQLAMSRIQAAAQDKTDSLTHLGAWLQGTATASNNALQHSAAQPTRFVICLLSVHVKEFKRILPMLREVFQQLGALSVLVAPRKVASEGRAFERILRQTAIPFYKRTQWSPAAQQPPLAAAPNVPRVVLLDTLGEAGTLLQWMHCVFLGGTFIPVGGHNVLEPLRARLPTFCGPYVEHIAALLAGFPDVVFHCSSVQTLGTQLLAVKKRFHFPAGNEALRIYKQRIGTLERQAGDVTAQTLTALMPIFKQQQ